MLSAWLLIATIVPGFMLAAQEPEPQPPQKIAIPHDGLHVEPESYRQERWVNDVALGGAGEPLDAVRRPRGNPRRRLVQKTWWLFTVYPTTNEPACWLTWTCQSN